jgi:hypothetical protein
MESVSMARVGENGLAPHLRRLGYCAAPGVDRKDMTTNRDAAHWRAGSEPGQPFD